MYLNYCGIEMKAIELEEKAYRCMHIGFAEVVEAGNRVEGLKSDDFQFIGS